MPKLEAKFGLGQQVRIGRICTAGEIISIRFCLYGLPYYLVRYANNINSIEEHWLQACELSAWSFRSEADK